MDHVIIDLHVLHACDEFHFMLMDPWMMDDDDDDDPLCALFAVNPIIVFTNRY